MTSQKDTGTFRRILIALVITASVVLPVIAGYLVATHRPLTRAHLTDVIGHLDQWKIERRQAPGTPALALSNAEVLAVYTGEHRAAFIVSSGIYGDPNYFNAAAFEKEVKKGQALVFTVRHEGSNLIREGRIELFGLATERAVYLDADKAVARYAQQRQQYISLFIGSLVLAAVLLVAARMMWKKKST